MSQTGTDYIGNLNKRVEGRGGGQENGRALSQIGERGEVARGFKTFLCGVEKFMINIFKNKITNNQTARKGSKSAS